MTALATTSQELSALSEREFVFLDRIFKISCWLAVNRRPAVVKMAQDDFHLTEGVAEQWVQKAEDAMALTAIENVDTARTQFRFRLEQIFTMAMANARRDEIEVVHKPIRVEVKVGDSDAKVQTETIQGTVTKIRKDVFDPNALNIALKTAREIARVQGIMGRDGKGGINVGTQVNVHLAPGSNIPTAQGLDTMDNAALLRMLGADVVGESGAKSVEVLPGEPEQAAGQSDGAGGEEIAGEED